jgi:hypothetical protein
MRKMGLDWRIMAAILSKLKEAIPYSRVRRKTHRAPERREGKKENLTRPEQFREEEGGEAPQSALAATRQSFPTVLPGVQHLVRPLLLRCGAGSVGTVAHKAILLLGSCLEIKCSM